MLIRIQYLIPALLLLLSSIAGQAQERALPQSQAQMQLSFAPLVRQISPAVVNIYTKRTVSKRAGNPFLDDPLFAPFFGNQMSGGRMRKQVENSLGSGVIIQPDGLVVTNTHVIRGADEITIGLADGREFDANLVLEDDASDLALLRFDTKGEEVPYATLKPSESLEVGDIVLAIGNPFGVGQTVTSGIVSALARSSLDINDFNFFIQTDAAINPGNSGGPLVALDGGVVGINTAIYSRSGGSLGIGFAIPSEMVATVLAAEKMGHTGAKGVIRPWLGVTVQTVTSDIAESLNMDRPYGALVVSMHQSSPLKKAGVAVGDVVLSFNGKTIRDPSEMKFRMAMVPLGEKAQIEVSRQGKTLPLAIEAMAAPEDPPRNAVTIEGNNPLVGTVVANMNPAVAVELGMIGTEEGIVVLDVPQNTAAARLVSPGDFLVRINGVGIKKSGDVQKALKSPTPQGWIFVITSHGRTTQIVIH